ncbi:MAG: enoyl-CoA hydratase/isomerase family protein [Caldilineales bacterium]|nr:enoyl-CoA hydratase/isomerase family protein [Caldilineales bacterium]
MSDSFLTIEITDGVAVLTLNRPPVNVLHLPMLRELDAALAALAEDEGVRALIVQAAGKLFSAGVDVADHTADKVGEMIPLFDRVCQALAEFPTPTVAAVQGHALGGGCELVLCCDLAVLAEHAKIGQPEIQLASFAPIAALRLPYLVGYRAAADLMFSGRSLGAAEALQMGVVNAVLPAAEVQDWARAKAAVFAAMSRAAMHLLKRSLLLGYGDWAARLPAIEQVYLQELMATADAHEGLTAFLEKRAPLWRHH